MITILFQFTVSTPLATSTGSSKGMKSFREEKALIAVMDTTGSGKSSLTRAIAGRENIVGHALEPGWS